MSSRPEGNLAYSIQSIEMSSTVDVNCKQVHGCGKWGEKRRLKKREQGQEQAPETMIRKHKKIHLTNENDVLTYGILNKDRGRLNPQNRQVFWKSLRNDTYILVSRCAQQFLTCADVQFCHTWRVIRDL